MDLKALYKLSYGLYVVGTKAEDTVNAQVANTVFQINSEPATVAISLNNNNYTNELVKKSGVFSVNVLAETADLAIVGNFGFRSGRDNNKFKDYKYVEGVTGSPLLQGSNIAAILEAKVIHTFVVGTHTLFIGEIVNAENFDSNAMTYAMYHKLKNAAKPAASAAPKAKGKAYKCDVCGYVVEEGFEDLPDDWVCPICGVGKDQFSPVEEDSAASKSKGKAYKCDVCGYVVEEGFEDLPDDWVCPICGVGKDQFSPVE